MIAARPLCRVPPQRRTRVFAARLMLAAAALTVAMVVPQLAHAADSGAAGTPGTANPSGWTLDRLMSTLGQKKSGHASFVETKYLSIASEPVTSSGVLVFTAPDHLEKRT